MITIVVGVVCLALGIWLGRWWANKAVLALLDELGIAKHHEPGIVGSMPNTDQDRLMVGGILTDKAGLLAGGEPEEPTKMKARV